MKRRTDFVLQRTETSSSSSSSSSCSSSSSSTSSSTSSDHDSSDFAARRKALLARLEEEFSVWDFVDPSKPWVLAENGSFAGFFDYVPEQYRIGPWSPAAVLYLTTLYAAATWAAWYLITNRSQTWLSTEWDQLYQYPAYGSPGWLYFAGSFVWMFLVACSVATGPGGPYAWSAYTVQSWTLLTIRHGLCALAPFSKRALFLAELTRFPAACSATVTFCVWNFALLPFILLVGLKTAEERRGFIKFSVSFRSCNLHMLNIVFCYASAALFSPPRRLDCIDWYGAAASVLLYILFYFTVLDRLGVHLYPIFSPRAHWTVVIVSWTSLIALYVAVYQFWQTTTNHYHYYNVAEDNVTTGAFFSSFALKRDPVLVE